MKVELFLPEEAPNYDWANEWILNYFADTCGGVTVHKGLQGLWTDPKTGNIVSETITKYEIWCRDDTVDDIRSIMFDIKIRCKQKEILLSIDNKKLMI